MISIGINATIIMQIIQFLLIVAVVNFLILKPVRGAMDRRSAKIDALLKDADDNRLSIEAQKKKYEEKMLVLRAELADYHNKIKSDALRVSQALIDDVKSVVAKELEVSRAQIQKEADVARMKLKDESDGISAKIINIVTDKTA